MNIHIIVFIVACCAASGNTEESSEDCNKDVSKEFIENYYKFCTKIFRITALKYYDHFVNSPYNMWLTLAAVGEGVTGPAQEEIFTVLNLPKETCLRQKYYELALQLEEPARDVVFLRKRFAVFDKDVKLNSSWVNAVTSTNLIRTVLLPLREAPELAAYHLSELSSSRFAKRHVAGNSLLVDSLDYSGLWTTAFPDAQIAYDMPFYNDAGYETGTVDYLTSSRRARVTYMPEINAKVLILPVGANSRYIMIIAVSLDQNSIKRTIEKFVDADLSYALQNSNDTDMVKIAIPKFTLTTETENMREILEDLGIKGLWRDEGATKLISQPAAKPVSYVHRVTMTVHRYGTEEQKPKIVSLIESFDADIKTEDTFIVNRPFIFGLIDSQTSSNHLCGVFSKPTYF